jgi:DNA-binding MarR family transcriptional regulator
MTGRKAPRAEKQSDPLGSLLGYQLRRASNALLATLAEALAAHELSIVEASVLLVIAENDGLTQSEIGRLLDIHRANMVPIAAKLARLGYTTGEQRGRQQVLRASAEGRRAAQRVRAIMHRHESVHFGALAPGERARLLAWLRALWQTEQPCTMAQEAPRAQGRHTRKS